MYDSITVAAPAKINLGLEVYPRRADGYHDIRSVFTTVGLFDEITVTLTDRKNSCIVECDAFRLPEVNTFTSAYKAFCVLTGIDRGVRVEVRKRIPAGGGLGGGSSDASSFIQSIDSLMSTKLNTADLVSIADKVGSDVFFFTHALSADGGARFRSFIPYAAIVGGRGEDVVQIKEREDFSVLLVFPGVSVSTKEAYGLVDAEIEANGFTAQEYSLEEMFARPVRDWRFANHFTAPVCRHYPQVKAALDLVRDCGADFCDMSGSGSTVFGVFEDRKKAMDARDRIGGIFEAVLA